MSRQPFSTAVRRNHIIGPAGVGSLILTRNGITALLCGLPTWLNQAPLRGVDDAARSMDLQRLLDDLTLHDINAERELSVARLIQPPVVNDSIGFNVTWFIPSIRFPLSEYCTNPSCRSIQRASPENPSVSYCRDSECAGQRKRSSRTQQVPIVLACSEGHLDEPDFVSLTHSSGPCNPSPRLQYKPGNVITCPEIICRDCGNRVRLSNNDNAPCAGRRPWIIGMAPDSCGKKTTILDRTDTRTYYPDVRSHLHIPASNGLRDTVLRWLQNDHIAHALSQVGPQALPQIHQRAVSIFPDLSEQGLAKHMQHLAHPEPQESGPDSEIAALTSGQRGIRTSDGPPVLDAEVIPVDRFDSRFISSTAPITGVVAVHRLAETRTLAGFTRIEPPNSQATRDLTGYQLLWGRRTPRDASEDWLPGMRLYGEGIYLELNQEHVNAWASGARTYISDITVSGETLTPQFQVAHTLAHLMMNAASLECGYPVASLRDRIYTTSETTAFLIYTGDGDLLGTLGGLVELAQPGSLEQLLEKAYNAADWCSLDPVCMNPVQHVRSAAAGACHQCCLLPETSCAWWNNGLDRATLVGRDQLAGYLR